MPIDVLNFLTRRGVGLRDRFGHTLTVAAAPSTTQNIPFGVDERTARQWDGDVAVFSVFATPTNAVTAGATQPVLNLVRLNPATGAVTATAATLSLAATSLVAGKPQAFALTAANTTVLPGEVLALQVVQPASGVGFTNLLVEVEMTRPA